MSHWTNPDYRLHIDMLRAQAKVGNLVWTRMVRDERYTEATQLHNELVYLNTIIATKEGRHS